MRGIAVDSVSYLVSRLSMTIRHDGVPAKAVSPLRVDYCFLNFHFSIIIALAEVGDDPCEPVAERLRRKHFGFIATS